MTDPESDESRAAEFAIFVASRNALTDDGRYCRLLKAEVQRRCGDTSQMSARARSMLKDAHRGIILMHVVNDARQVENAKRFAPAPVRTFLELSEQLYEKLVGP